MSQWPPDGDSGWLALDAVAAGSGGGASDMERALKGCFGTPAGEVALACLRSITLDVALPPTATDAELRHLEGQRALVRYIITMTERQR